MFDDKQNKKQTRKIVTNIKPNRILSLTNTVLTASILLATINFYIYTSQSNQHTFSNTVHITNEKADTEDAIRSKV